MVLVQFSLLKKLKIERTENLLPPFPLVPLGTITSHFCFTPTPLPLKVDAICVLPRIMSEL